MAAHGRLPPLLAPLALLAAGLVAAASAPAAWAVGNPLSEERPAGTTTYTYDPAHQLSEQTGLGGVIAYTYDRNGNQTQKGARSYSYDLADRLRSTSANGQTITYAYDGEGKRSQQAISDGATLNYLWDKNHPQAQLALERNASNGTNVRAYRHGLDLISMSSGGAEFYYHHDGLGSVSNITNASGAAQWTYEYEPYGQLRSSTQNDPAAPTNLTRFTGELYDPETTLYHLRARQYDPTNGRFLTTDPISPEIGDPYVSAYIYVNQRPGVLVDPSGMSACDYLGGLCDEVSDELSMMRGWALDRGRAGAGLAYELTAKPFVDCAQGSRLGCVQAGLTVLAPGIGRLAGIALSRAAQTAIARQAARSLTALRANTARATRARAQALAAAGRARTQALAQRVTPTLQRVVSDQRGALNLGAFLRRPRAGAEAAEAGGEGVTPLYRAVNAAERNNAIESQLFTQGPNSMEGKWFAEQAPHAAEWGRWFYGQEPFHILETKVPSTYAERLHFHANLDSIGPARYVRDLEELNRVHLGVREYTP